MTEPGAGQSVAHKGMNNWFRKPPIQRQKWGEKQSLPHVDWGDLFFDLFYVAGAYNLSYIIKADKGWTGVLYFFGCFGPLFGLWMNRLSYDARFQLPDDIMHFLGELVNVSILAAAVLHVRPVTYMSDPTKPEMFAFSLAIFCGAAFTMVWYAEIKWFGVDGNVNSKAAAVTSMCENIVTLVLSGAAVIYSAMALYNHDDDHHGHGHRLLAEESHEAESDHTAIILLICAWLGRAALMYPILYIRGRGHNFKDYTVPFNVGFAIHRYGEFIMLMLGESVLSLLIVDIEGSSDYYLTFFVGILSTISLQYLHFKSQPEHAEGHAMRRSRAAGVAFNVLLQFYSASLILVGVSYKMLLSEYGYADEYVEEHSDDHTDDHTDDHAGDHTDDHTDGGHRNLMSRLLAGGGGMKHFPRAERRQRIAIFFCVATAAVFVLQDLMMLAHNGIEKTLERARGSKTGTQGVTSVVIFIVLRMAVVVFIGTACIYVNDNPEEIALMGYASVLMQIILRLLAKNMIGEEEHGHDEHSEEEGHDEHGSQDAMIDNE